MEELSKCRPADRCAVCERTIAETGGRRLVATLQRGFAVVEHCDTSGWENFRSCTRLFEDRELFMVAWGEQSAFPGAAISRALGDFRNGLRPWFCQCCGRRACSACGELLWRPVASSYVFDDGHVVYCPILGADPGCWNEHCAKFRPSLGIRHVHWDRLKEANAKEQRRRPRCRSASSILVKP